MEHCADEHVDPVWRSRHVCELDVDHGGDHACFCGESWPRGAGDCP